MWFPTQIKPNKAYSLRSSLDYKICTCLKGLVGGGSGIPALPRRRNPRPSFSFWLSLGRKDEVSWSQGSNLSLTAAFRVQWRLRSKKF